MDYDNFYEILELALPREDEITDENRVIAHPDDCKVFYIFNFPMTCGEELVFDPNRSACVPPEMVADSRPECAGGEE